MTKKVHFAILKTWPATFRNSKERTIWFLACRRGAELIGEGPSLQGKHWSSTDATAVTCKHCLNEIPNLAKLRLAS